jgi:hypothetical protein
MTPYRQGDLDSLCGLYSIVNAVAVAAGRRKNSRNADQDRPGDIPLRRFDKLRAELLLFSLTRYLERGRMLSWVFATGTTTQRMSQLLKHASRYLRVSYDTELVWTKPFHRDKSAQPRAIAKTIREHLNRPYSAVIIKVLWGFEHWTVIAWAKDTGFKLVESECDRQAWISTRRRVTWQRALHISRIVPTSVFLVRLQRARRRRS